MAVQHIRTAGKFFRQGDEKWLLKGVSYGPFAGADSLPSREQVEADMQGMARLGVNTLRVYVPPPSWFFAACAARGLHVLVGLQWPAHTDFLQNRHDRREILAGARQSVRTLSGSPGLLGFFVANEVAPPLVRWLGAARVRDFLERLIEAGRGEAPDLLFAYATYPSTEFLNPRNADFIAYNVYLERRTDFEKYLARLQNIAGNQPLVVSEFGLDTRRHSEAAQAEAVLWAWEAALRAGLAGLVLFAYTDEWFTGGLEVAEWDFGLVTRDRREKEAFHRLAAWLPNLHRPGQGVRLRELPRFSVIVCSFNGSSTLRRALESLQQLAYADYEVIVVDDGSTDSVSEIAAEFRELRYFRLDHRGLSAARNFGARQAEGEILAYLDDDAAADEDWLIYLALAFENERVGAAGGPNIPPENRGLVAACVSAAPGGPMHVLMNDSDAEHLPGCNLAVRKAAWEEIGGFDEQFATAGDDVDFCWRLMDHGYKISFHAGAMVWHERRRTVRGFLRQQMGYGAAEAMLIAQHQHRFGKLGGARWRGSIYGPHGQLPNRLSGRIYHGVFGYAPFQILYGAPHPAGRDVVISFQWLLAAGCVGIAGCWLPWASAIAALMLLVPVVVALQTAGRCQITPPHNHPAGKIVVFFLTVLQPWVRGAVRLGGCIKRGAFPSGPWLSGPLLCWPSSFRRKSVTELVLWNEHGRDRDLLLRSVIEELAAAQWPVTPGNAWTEWDFEVPRGRWWVVRCTTVTELHRDQQRLTRVRLSTRANRPTLWLGALLVIIVLPVAWVSSVVGLWLLAMSFLTWLALEFHHGAVASQVLRLVLYTARGLGFRQIEDPPDASNEDGNSE
ncbi:MAG: glycosyltransferase [Verrucomicrobiales bacterium]